VVFAGYQLAGAGGFEPPNGGIKILCLTSWLRPNQPGRLPGTPLRGNQRLACDNSEHSDNSSDLSRDCGAVESTKNKTSSATAFGVKGI
jgi:hypothetical protein